MRNIWIGLAIIMIAMIGMSSAVEKTNTVVATGDDGNGGTTEARATAMFSVIEEPGMQLTKEADVKTAFPGDIVKYTYTVLNNGTSALTNLVTSDEQLGSISMDKTSLKPGEFAVGTKTYTIKESDLITAEVVNYASASAISADTKLSVNASASVKVLRPPIEIEVTKTPDKSEVRIGDIVTTEVIVTNVGKTTAYNVTAIDTLDNGETITIDLSKTTLAPGESVTGTIKQNINTSML